MTEVKEVVRFLLAKAAELRLRAADVPEVASDCLELAQSLEEIAAQKQAGIPQAANQPPDQPLESDDVPTSE